MRAGDDPEALVFNPTAKKVHAANEGDGTLTVVAGATRDSSGKLSQAWTAQTPATTAKVSPTTLAKGDEGQALAFGEVDNNYGSFNSANNLALAADRGAKVSNVRQGSLYVTSEGITVTVIDLSKFGTPGAIAGSLTIEGGHHIDWPVITPPAPVVHFR